MLSDLTDNTWAAGVYNQSAMMIRLLVSGTGSQAELAYACLGNPKTPGNGPASNEKVIYEGQGRLRVVQGGWSSRYYQDGWTLGGVSNGRVVVSGSFENTYATTQFPGWTHAQYYTNTLPTLQDAQGRQYHYQYDSDGFVTQKKYSDNTTETWKYNAFKEVTRYQDRLGRVTLYNYDAHGNLLYRAVGLVYNATSKTDVKQPEYAVYHWDYYSDSETVGGVAQPANFLKRAYEPNTSTNQPNGTGVFTKYVYNAQNLLAQVLEPNDTGSGTHRAGAFGYNGFGLVASSSDACNRTVQYSYDLLNRPKTITYGDNSTEEFLYGTGEQSHLLAAKKDRNGSVTAYAYDSHSRPIEVAEAVASTGTSTTTGTILTGYTPPNLSSNPALPAVAAVTTWQYLPGTELPTSVTRLGNATNYAYDYRQRLISTGVPPSAGVAPLVSTSSYVNNDLFSEADPYGRKTYYAYQASDGALLRTVQGTLPSFTLSYGSVTTAARPTIPNPNCLIKDYTLDAMDQVLQTTDPRGLVSTAAYDSRGRVTDSYAAYGSAVQAHTQTVYNLNSTVQAVRSPRYFDATDANGQNKASETWTYTNRDLRATHTVAAGDAAYPSGAKATE